MAPLFIPVVEMSFPILIPHFGGAGSFMTENSNFWVVFMVSCDHSNLSSERWEKLDGVSDLGGGWGTYGEGVRMTVPDDVRDVLRMERKAAEVDRRRLGGENVEASFF
jgi:hypothetical protein